MLSDSEVLSVTIVRALNPLSNCPLRMQLPIPVAITTPIPFTLFRLPFSAEIHV